MNIDREIVELVRAYVACESNSLRMLRCKVLKTSGNQSDQRMCLFEGLKKLNLIEECSEETFEVLDLIIDAWEGIHYSILHEKESKPIFKSYPAYELVDTRHSSLTDKWGARWNAAGNSVNWKGAIPVRSGKLCAMKNSPIWRAIGFGAGGYRDTLNVAYPPFVAGEHVTWFDLSVEECERIGLVSMDWYKNQPKTKAEKDIARAIKRFGGIEKLLKDFQ